MNWGPSVANHSRQAHLYLSQDMQNPLVESCLDGAVAVYSKRCPDKPSPNEDAAAVIEIGSDSAVLAVADGLGGGPDGERASRIALQSLRHVVQAATARIPEIPLRTCILEGIDAANDAVMKSARGGATTLAVAEIRNGSFRPYHIGDSIVWLVSSQGRVKFESLPHSPVGYALESGLLTAEEAMHHKQRHLVSNVVGCKSMHIDVGPLVKLSKRDTVLLASDGLVDNLTLEEISRRAKRRKIGNAIRGLTRDATQRMLHPRPEIPSKPDDLTVVLYRPTRKDERRDDFS